MPTEQRLGRRDGQQAGQQVGCEPRLEDNESSVDPGAAQVGGVLGEVRGSKPFHDPVVGPEGHLLGRRGHIGLFDK